MRTFVELAVKGGKRVVVDTSAIIGMEMPVTKMTMATTESPIRLIVRDADPIEVVAVEPAMLLGRIAQVIDKADQLKGRDDVPPLLVAWMEDDGD